MKIFIWNCQGATSRAFRRTVKNHLRDHKPCIACLLEPRVFGNHANDICFSLDFDKWLRVEAFGFSGDIWVLWKESILVEVLQTHPQFVTLRIKGQNNQPWIFLVVYGSPDFTLRKEQFLDLSIEMLHLQGAWLTAGDFNSVINKNEVSINSNFSLTRCTGFANWIEREGLVDLGYTGSKFTWSRGNQTDTLKVARLDRALGNIEWKILFPEAEVIHLPMVSSDHAPLLINTDPPDTNRKPTFTYGELRKHRLGYPPRFLPIHQG